MLGTSRRPQEADPRHAASGEVGLLHLPERPVLEVGASDLRAEDDTRTGVCEPQAELTSSIDGRIALRIEPAGALERIAAHGADPRPERRRRACRPRVDVVVQEIPEPGG